MLKGTLIEDWVNLLMLGLAINALVQLVQKLPWPSAWMQRRPLGCKVCLSHWAGIIGWAVVGERIWPSVVFWGAGVGAALLIDALQSHWRPMPPPM